MKESFSILNLTNVFYIKNIENYMYFRYICEVA